jgi:hypothetical protein
MTSGIAYSGLVANVGEARFIGCVYKTKTVASTSLLQEQNS